jgi:beta-lactamase regulating signal transducer with metallopeptidase domain
VTAVQAWSGRAPLIDHPGQTAIRESMPAATEPGRQVVVSRQPAAQVPAGVTIRETWSEPPAMASWLPMLFLGWLVGVGVLTLRLLSGWIWVQRLRSQAAVPAAAAIDVVAGRLIRRLHISRTVRFLQSSLVEVPTVIGWMRPVVLIPASALAGLSPVQLEAILAHELAHIRRHDYLVNLLQTLVETLLFYHPAVWWLSRRIRIEREHCCDDLAVGLCGDPVTYARALADLEALRSDGHQLVLAANGGSLLDRVRRLLGAPSHAGRGPGWAAVSVSVLVIAAIAAGAIGSDVRGSEQPAASASATASAQASPASADRPVTARSGKARGETQPLVAAQQAAAAGAAQEAEAQAREMSRHAEATAVVIAQQSAAIERSAAALEASGTAAAQAAVVAAGEALALALAEAASGPSMFAGVGQSKGNFTWSRNGEKLTVNYEGAIEFTDDDTDVQALSPGGWLKIKEGGLLASKSVEFRADASGRIERRFWSGMSERPFEPEGRQWLAQTLPRFIRQTALGAPARVARILRQKGPDGVLGEISLIEGSWAKRIYFTELLKAGKLDPQAVERVLAQAGRQIDSDFELASLLIGSADQLLVNDATRKAYFDAAQSIRSDFEMRRVYSSSLKQEPLTAAVLASLLEASHGIDSDFEAASLLIEIAKLQPLDDRTRPLFFKVLGTIASDFEHRRVLTALLARGDAGSQTRAAVLDSAMQIDSDFEKASLLLSVVKPQGLEDAVRPQFFRAVETINSPFERGRVLKAVLQTSDASPDALLDVLRATRDMNGNFEASQVLLAVAAKYTLSGEARDVYIDIAERLGDFEQGRVLAALVKSERRK